MTKDDREKAGDWGGGGEGEAVTRKNTNKEKSNNKDKKAEGYHGIDVEEVKKEDERKKRRIMSV